MIRRQRKFCGEVISFDLTMMQKTSPRPSSTVPIRMGSTPVPAGLLQRKCSCGNSSGKEGECEECKKKEGTVQRKSVGGSSVPAAPPIVHQALRSPGQPLDSASRAFFEPRFGHDFGNVRVHAGGLAAESARAVDAHAYTVGRDIVLGSSASGAGSAASRQLLAHELAHTIQQGSADLSRTESLRVNEPGDAHEQEADRAANSVTQPQSQCAAHSAIVRGEAAAGPAPALQRQTVDPKDDPKRLEKVHESLFGPAPAAGTSGSSSPGAATTTLTWDATAKSKVISQLTQSLSDRLFKMNRAPGDPEPVPERTTQSGAEAELFDTDKELRKHFPMLPAALPPATFKGRVHVMTNDAMLKEDFLRQRVTPVILTDTDVLKYGVKAGDTNFDKLLDDIFADPSVARKIRTWAPFSFGGYTSGTGQGSPEIILNQGLPSSELRSSLLHELVHFYTHKNFVDWVASTLTPTEYSEGIAEYLARIAMSEQEKKDHIRVSTYNAFVAKVEKEITPFVPDDDIARAVFLGEVWRIEGKSQVAMSTFKEQTGLKAAATHKEEQKESLAGPGIIETVVEGAHYRFMNLADEHPEPKPQHVTFFQEIYTKHVANDATVRLRFVGHASSPGTVDFNEKLSLKRSKAFYKMARDTGVPEDQLLDAKDPPHFGETQPTLENEDVQGRAFNRRVELLITQVAASSSTTSPQSPETTPTEKKESPKGEDSGTLDRKAVDGRPVAGVPPIVHEVLRSPGQPLDTASRAFFEPRFGHDFSKVRVHTDERAAQSARSVNALAYAVGRDIVFDSQQYAPHSIAGRKLLAHELSHVVQQRHARSDPHGLALDAGRTDPREREAEAISRRLLSGQPVSIASQSASAAIQRQPKEPELTPDAAGGCGVCFRGDLKAVGNTAHALIQAEFESLYPGLITNFPLKIKGKPFIISEGVPDLVLPTPRGLKIGEIKPANPNGYFEGDAKVQIYKRLAEEKFNKPIPKISIEPLDVPPPPPVPFVDTAAINCPQQALITSPSVRGVYGYLCWPPFRELIKTCKCKQQEQPKPVPVGDPAKENEKERKKKTEERVPIGLPHPSPVPVAIALAMAAMGFAIKKFGAKAAGGYATAVVTLMAASYLLASGKAYAKPGPGGEEPVLLLIKALEQQGTPVPPELQKMIESNPDLRAKLNKAMTHGGDVSAAQEEINKQILQILQEHQSEFSEEDLEVLLGATKAAGQAIPKGDVTAQTLQSMLHQAQAGGGGAGGGKGNVWEQAKQAGAKEPTPPPSGAAPKTQSTEGPERGDVWERAKAGGDSKSRGLSPESHAKIAGAKAPARALFDAIISGTGSGAPLTDDGVNRFFSIIPENLTASQAKALIGRLAPAEGQSLDQILDTLQGAIEEMQKGKDPAKAAATQVEAQQGPQPTEAKPDAGTGGQNRIAELAKLAAATDFSDLHPGETELSWAWANVNPQGQFQGTVRYVGVNGVNAVAYCTGRIVERKKNATHAQIISADPLVDSQGNIVVPAKWLEGKNFTGSVK
jgi:Zn-dependent peptidase ImmA (M78 family)